MTWIILVAALAAEPTVQTPSTQWTPEELEAAEIAPGEGPEIHSVPRLSRSPEGRAVRLVAEATAGSVGAIAGGYAFAAAGFLVGDLLGGCAFMEPGGIGCWLGGMAGALMGHPLGLIAATHLTGHLLGTDTPLVYTALGALVGEGAMIATYWMVHAAGGAILFSGADWAYLALPGVVAAVFHELADGSAGSSPVVVAPMPLRSGGGLAALVAF